MKEQFFEIWTFEKRGKMFGCLLAAVLMFGIVHYPTAVSVVGTSRQLPIYCVQRDQKLVSISFDAAWGDVRVRHIREWFSADCLIKISYHKKRLVMEVVVP